MDIPSLEAIGGASAAAVVWRQRGRLHLTIVVKGTFGAALDAVMTPAPPEPIAAGEQDDGSGMGLYSAGDLAPYLLYTDVELTGHAHAPAGASEIEARLEVIRDGIAMLDKSVRLVVPEGEAGREIPVRLVGMGPLSKDWPIRRRLLGEVDPRALGGPIVEIPDSFDWSYFQAAPVDQRIGPLRGDEWVAVRGVQAKRPWLRSQLPGARGLARIRGTSSLRPTTPVQLGLDTVHLDIDLLRCTLLWRGVIPIDDAADLQSIHVAAGMELPGETLAWPDSFRDAPPSHVHSREAYADTLALDVAEIERHVAAAGPRAS